MTRELESMMKAASAGAERLFEKNGCMGPMYYAVRRNGEAFAFSPPGTKNKSIAIVREIFERLDVVRYTFVDEAWFLETQIDPSSAERAKIDREGIADNSDSVEVVLIMGEDAEGQRIAMRRIVRPDGKPPYLEPMEFEDMSQSEGRMTGLLPRPKGTRLS